jgi:SAM-dependent methyltransferase
MNWRFKAALHQALTVLPFGDRIHYWAQRHVIKSLPASERAFTETVTVAKRHLEEWNRYGNRDAADATFYEFGAGRDLIVPFYLYCMGMERQTVVDVQALAKVELVNETIRKFRTLELRRIPSKFLPQGPRRKALSLLEEWYGIRYVAPADPRNTGLDGCSMDFISSTNTLEHIPPSEIPLTLQECFRLLKDDGLMGLRIDYQDHYSYSDPGISAYNFLQYSPFIWKLYSPSMHFQNRLRHRDYLDLITRSGFVVLRESLQKGAVEDLQVLRHLLLDDSFQRRYTLEEMAIRTSYVVARKGKPIG